MNKLNNHNSRENRTKTLFRAPKGEKQAFNIGQISYRLLLLSLFLIITFSFIESVESKRSVPVTFGTEKIVNIFPAEVIKSDWSGVEAVLIQDLSDESIYQDFSARNSAYLVQEVLVLPNVPNPDGSPTVIAPLEGTDAASTTETQSSETQETQEVDESPTVGEEEFVPETVETPEPEIELEPAPSQEESGPVSQLKNQYFVANSSVGVFPLLQFTSNSSTEPSFVEEQLLESEQEEVAQEDEEVEVGVEDSTEQELTQEVLETPVIATSTDESDVQPETEMSDEEGQEVATSTASSTIERQQLQSDLPVHEITLANFDTAVLERGQVVNGMQLRMSLGGRLEKASTENTPYIDVFFGPEGEEAIAGSVILDDEVSNALNGGYFLFALPELQNINKLKDMQVTVRFYGDKDDLDGLFLDAVWLELDTKLITKKDLAERGAPTNFEQLTSPELSTLISDKVNFKREERPVFNLRYNSQRNFIVRGIRNLIGRDLAVVEEVMVRHNSEGLLNVYPKVTTTKDGLLSLEFSEEDRKQMRPGQYTVEVDVNEGGRLFTDSFDFQWGILTTNPNKSEYETGERAHISIGALTPNGHTICQANLHLYVIAPDETIERVEVNESGLCDGNNVIDVPDFYAYASTTMPGAYELYLERLDDKGDLLGYTTDTFNVVDEQDIAIERVGPTRIYPPAPYPMTLTVNSNERFVGTLTERVPASFAVSSTTANIEVDGDWQILTWDLSLSAGESESVSYGFDAPDISPYLFNLGPARLDSAKLANNAPKAVASSTSASTSTASSTSPSSRNSDINFIEHRQWQIASDAVGKMLLFWDDGASIPTDWVCVSCTSGDPFFQSFGLGSSTYNVTGGSPNHTHTAAGSVLATSDITTEASGSGNISVGTHSHTYTPTISTESNLPPYRQLRIIRYDVAAGEPATIPAGAIGIFDVASSSLPVGWNRYTAQDGYFIRGEDTPGTTGGAETHTHTISGTTGASTGGSYRSRGPDGANGADLNHTHTVSSATAADNHVPPYIEVVLAQLSADAAPTNGLIAMWDEDVDNSWLDVSSDPADPFSNRFLRASTTYGATGGATTHTPADVTGITSSGPNATVATARSGAGGASDVHTHSVDVTGFNEVNHLPPYTTIVYGKRQGTDPVYEQFSSRWYVNKNDQTPDNPWPETGGDLAERAPITSADTPVKSGDIVRLRMNLNVTNATSTAGASFKLQYAAGDTCSAGLSWFDVGDNASSTVWRGYNNSTPADGSTLVTTLLGSTTVAATYEEDGTASSTPNDINVDDYGEWDFVLEQNDAAAGTNYCFRMVEGDGTQFFTYSHYPQLITNEAPAAPEQSKLFDNEKTASTTPWFEFTSTDTEGEKIHYQIQIDDNFDFGSTVFDRDTISNASEFENQALVSDKAPFIQGNLIRFTPPSALSNGTTYYWRVRGQDPDGSNQWGDWSTTRSFTIDTTLTASAWFQTQDEQFDTGTLVGVETGSDQVALISGSTTGSMISTPIEFTDGELGTAWDNLTWNDTETAGTVLYQLQYFDATDTWTLIPDGDLPGNSSGFGTSPVSLLDLDTDTYSTIRLVANFTDSGSSPSLQDWTINWGYRVEIPTISKLFSNEQTGTTTPTLEFTTSDPQGDSLTYQVQWSLTPDFTASTTRTSDADTGFANIDVGIDTDPFFSGDTIQYTIQPADALTGTTTYWWRVRAKDTTGDDAWSFWTDARSFTVIPGTEVSTWFQTTSEQFNTNILSGTTPLATDVVTVATTATEAMLVYGEGTVNTPRYRQWNGSSWGTEGSMLDIGAPVKWAVVKAGTTREEYVAATVGTDNDVNAQVFSVGEWGNLQEMTLSMGNINARGFDVVYETLSGDAMVAYCDGDGNPSYYIWNGTSWTSGGAIGMTLANNCEWLKLAADPTSDEIIVMARDSVGTAAASYEVRVWNGSAWANSATQGGARNSLYETLALNYEDSGGQALSISGDGNPTRFEYNSWNGTAWAGLTNNSTISDNLIWAELSRDDGTDAMGLCYVDESANIGVIRWTGTAWTGQTDLDAAGKGISDRPVSCQYETTAGRDGNLMVLYSDTTNARYQFFNGATWSGESTISTITDASTVQSTRTGNGTILGLFFDDTNDSLDFSSWDGSAWSTAQTLETNMSVDASPFGEPFMVTPRNSGKDGTTIVSPAINFDDGLGPYWQEFSWNDTQPGTSQILYYMQYQTATGSWAFIPDGDLPGNGSGTTTGPYDLSGLNTNTYDTLRPYAELSCDGSGNCPEIQDWKVTWAGGITISGTAYQYDEVASTTSGTVAVAVNGVLQTGKTGSINNGFWSISNVTAFEGDIITVFVNGAADANEAVAVARYDGQGDMSGVVLYERHLSLGSNDATTTPITNADIGQYDFTNTEDVFFDVTGSTLSMCADVGCSDAVLYVSGDTYYTPGGSFITHDFENNGVFTSGANQHEVSGSWDNNATTTMTGSTVVFAATSTTETIDSTGAVLSSFTNITFGTTTGNATWSLVTNLDVNGDLSVERGTLSRDATEITIAGDLTTGVNGLWTGIGTTTFDGNTSATWQDQNTSLQNVGRVVVDGTSKLVTLAGNVAAQSVSIGADDTLDASIGNYDITVYGGWNNQNNFLARSGEVFFAATSSTFFITTSGDAFYDLSFTGSAGGWAFTESTLLVNNNFTASSGVVTLPTTGTTTIGGSFDATNGSFGNNNGTLYFTSNGAETITFDGGAFTNVANNMTFDGGGNWTITDANATSSGEVRVSQGTLNFPSGVMAIGGSLIDDGGAFTGSTGLVLFYSTGAETVATGGSSFNDVQFNGTGSWTFTSTDGIILGDLLVSQGAVTLPGGTLYVGGSYINDALVVPGTGTVEFDSTDTGETVEFGTSSLYNVVFDSLTGGWTIAEPATTTNNFTIATTSDWTLAAGQALSVGGVFTNNVGDASTTWAGGSTLSLESGSYNINTKDVNGDVYDTLRISAAADISMWNSSASTYDVDSAGSLYSMDHAGTDGDLYIWGDYQNNDGNEYWSYATDFDGADLTGSERQVSVRFAPLATASFGTTTLEIFGVSTASTTIASQGGGTYNLSVSRGTTSAQYYEFSDLGATGFSLLDGTIVPVLRDGSYVVAANGGTAITLASTTIDANPGKQIYAISFATTTAISATNVTQTDGTPSSYWWFREGYGNLYGENYDNDTGDPGSVRFDDSSLVLTISGTVYDNTGTPITGGTCDDATQVVRIMVDGAEAATASCSSADGSYSAAGVVVVGDPTITVYLNNASGGERGSTITRTPTQDILNMDIYDNRVTVRNEDTEALTIENLAVFDFNDDADLQFVAATGTADTLTVLADNELFVFATSTFTPGGEVTLAGNAGANSYDGTLQIGADAIFNAYATSTLTIGGRLALESGAAFNAASTTVLMNATTSGKSITAADEVTFNELLFNGVGGSWNIGADIRVLGDMTITNGTVTGTGDITLPDGSLTGNGVLSLGAGTTTIASTNTLGGTSAWTFYNLQLGDGVTTSTSTPVFTSTTTVAGTLTIAAAHYLDAGSTTWDLSGAGTVLVENGTFFSDTSTVRYSGAGANVLGTQYYNLDIQSGAGSQTYTTSGIGLLVDNLLSVGGAAGSIFDIDTTDTTVDINGDVLIRSNGTISASDTSDLTIAGSYDNDGTFTANGGTVTFDGAGTISIAAGASDFASVLVDATGDVTVSEHATATIAWTLTNANTFTLDSSQSLAVGGVFLNDVGGAATTWTGSTLRLYGGSNYTINTATTSDSYATLEVDGTTQIRMWNSNAATYGVDTTASLYSQDHSDVAGDLYIYGAYENTSGIDYWSYTTDFDGTALGGSARKVDVYLASGASATYNGGTLNMVGDSAASTTVQNQGAGTYSLVIGGNTTANFQYYEIRDIDSDGIVFTGSPTVTTLSNGDLEVSQNGGTAITVGGSVITANPAKNFNLNRFALNGVGSGFNVTATGTSVSSWRFVNHYGDIDGESFDVDPDGDPGYVSWDDSIALITISGVVYSDEGATVSGVCDGSTTAITLVVAGITFGDTSCAAGTGVYSFSGVSYGPSDSLIVYINGAAENGATVTKQPISNIGNLDVYENRLIVRHESTDAITIDDLAAWDSSDDADIDFTAVNGSPDTLTLPADRKLIVWTGKEFAPGGNVTVAAGGSQAYGGSVELLTNATWTGVGTESLTIGGSLLSGTGATFVASNGTTTFTTTGAGRTIDVNEDAFNNVAFTGSGSWTMTDASATFNGDVSKTAGTLTLPSGTTTFSGAFTNTGGTFSANGGVAYFTGSGTHDVTLGGSDLATVEFAGGDYTITDTNATTTGSTTVSSGTVTLPSGVLAVGGDFENTAGSITHNTSEIKFTNVSSANLLASSSDLHSVRFAGGGAYTMSDVNVTFLGNLYLDSGSLTFATGTIAIGGSFDASGGTFSHSSSTILFNSADGGELIDPGVSDFYNVQIGAPTGGYTIVANATTTNNFTLASANSFTLQSGQTLYVEGVFTNSVGGANTTWSGSTLALNGANEYTINSKAAGGDQYETLIISEDTDIRMWDSAATTTSVAASASLYSQDNGAVDGDLYIYGDLHISTTTEYWSYATDFDGTSLSGTERAVNVYMAANATTSVDGGTLNIVGASGNETTITNQGSGTYALNVSDGTFLAQYYALRNMNSTGLNLSGTPTISSLSYGDYELAVDAGSLISLSSTTLNANASLVVTGSRFATTTTITGSNVTLTGTTPNVWTFTSHTGNLDGEDYDVDGATACGSVRWSDSSCLVTEQTQYRWRNDDGGLGVPNSEWYDANWDARKRVRIQNADTTAYTDAVVEMWVTYDADMQSDFDDLRFTADDGTTVLSHWIGSSTDSSAAEVWVKVPSLAAEDTTSVYMYYNNPSATSTASSTTTFIASDDFEDNNISEYSGETVDFETNGNADTAYGGSYGLAAASGNETGRTESGGIYRLDQTISTGQTIRYLSYLDTSQTDEVCTKFGIQTTGAPASNYGLCTDLNGTDRLVLVRNAVDTADVSPAVTLDSDNVTLTTGWYEFEIDWATSSIEAAMYDASGALVGTASSTDSNYSSGGFGFSFWYQHSGWDNFTVRKTLTTEPTVLFGSEQTDGGATWAAPQNTFAVYNVSDVARLRFTIENTGSAITNQQFLLEYAPKGSAPSCEAVDYGDFSAVPVQSSCGTSPVCMQSSTNVTNGASTFDLLAVDNNEFSAGEAREDPSNITGNINIGQDFFTELEYVLTPTTNVVDQNLCFRVTNNGTEYDTYISVAQMQLRFDPILASLSLNGGQAISLLPGTTTQVTATGTVTDLNGFADIVAATTTFYRGGVGAACSPDNNSCYVASTTDSSCTFTNCSGNTCDIECTADFFFHADPTDVGSAFEGQEWFAFVEVTDTSGGYDGETTIGQELNTLRAIDVGGAIDYGALAVNQDTGAFNASTSIENLGNVEVDVEVQGTDLTDGATSLIPADSQKFATSTFTYSSCGSSCTLLSSTTAFTLDVDLSKPTTDTPPVSDDVFWGIGLPPAGVNSAPHQGINVFTPVSP